MKGLTRMARQSCLDDPAAAVVADTSVVINLNASGYAPAILEALPNSFLVVSEVERELREDRQTGRNDAVALAQWVDSGRAEVVRLGERGMERFYDLVSGAAARTLDDGEAATIAHALETEPPAVPLIDERKANRICAERFAALVTGSTVDLLAQGDVRTALGPERLAEAVFDALRHGRMRVLPRHLEWVVDLMGPERARQCKSLPRSVRSG